MNEQNASYDSDQSPHSEAATRDEQGETSSDHGGKTGMAVTRDGQGEPGTDESIKTGLGSAGHKA